jgi:hypothetical protein
LRKGHLPVRQYTFEAGIPAPTELGVIDWRNDRIAIEFREDDGKAGASSRTPGDEATSGDTRAWEVACRWMSLAKRQAVG